MLKYGLICFEILIMPPKVPLVRYDNINSSLLDNYLL